MNHDSVLLAAYQGSRIADALSMPVHWYYDREALRKEYGIVNTFVAPHSVHTGSILFRSKYEAVNERGDILREQAQYWGKTGVHYHQFLKAGENTVNFKLAGELFTLVKSAGHYDADAWLERYIECMLKPGWHRDTYLEEYHRAFFTKYAQGTKPRKCGIDDGHIGGLAQVPALVAALAGKPLETLRASVKEHVNLTHANTGVLHAADTLVTLLHAISKGETLREAMQKHATDWISNAKAESWLADPDEHVIGRRFSPACYIDDAMKGSMYLAWKYHNDFAAGITANTMVGGDNCHRGAVVGSLLAAACTDWKAQSAKFTLTD
jgi:ADP-ribosyl-[dinitrogen reductase] hydrolase